jgi:hypothetical protein
VDGTLIEAWASHKSFQRKDRPAPLSDDPGNPTVNFHGERRSNETHESKWIRMRAWPGRAVVTRRNSPTAATC